MKGFTFRRGFTLVETLAVIIIMLVVTLIVVVSLSSLREQQLLSTETRAVASALLRARALTLASKEDVEYGVHFETSRVIIFKGQTYSAGDASNETETITNGVEISSITLSGGGSDVYFTRLTGTLNKNGTVVVSLSSDPSKTKTITLYGTGIFEVN